MNESEGVWAVVERDHYEHIVAVYPTELQALRAAVAAGYGRVQFVPWGKTLEGIDV